MTTRDHKRRGDSAVGMPGRVAVTVVLAVSALATACLLYTSPDIPTWNVVDARRGSGRLAEFAYIDDLDIAPDAALTTVCAAEVERNDELAQRAGVVTTAVAIDTRNWRVRRVQLSEDGPTGAEQGTCHQVCYLASPLLHTLPGAGGQRS